MIEKKERLLSLDVMRGITLMSMIIVNSPGSWSAVYPPLEHAEWNGLTPTDLVFPFFVFMMGISVTLSLSKLKNTDVPFGKVMRKVTKRAILLFLIGIFLALFPRFDFGHLRIPGVLQRLAIVYFFASLLYLKLSPKNIVWLSAAILVGYWLLLILYPLPDGTPANLDPGTNLAAWFDRTFIPGRLYRKTWDPEGILSTLPSIVTGLIGVLTGRLVIQKDITAEHKIIKMMSTGVVFGIIAYLWDLAFPFNKNLWSSSFVMITASYALLLLGSLYWFVDVLQYKKWTPLFVAFGRNAITAYVIHGLLNRPLSITVGGETLHGHSYNGIVAILHNPYLSSFIWAILYMLVCAIPIWWLYKKNIIIKL